MKNSKIKFSFIIVFLMILSLFIPANTAYAVVTGTITVRADKTQLNIGGTAQLTATVNLAGTTNKSVSYWSYSNNVTVNQYGQVTAVNPGEAYIEVSSVANPNISGGCLITVYSGTIPGTGSGNIRVTGISDVPAYLQLNVGETTWLAPRVLPENATNTSVAYSSTNINCVTVDQYRMVVAKAAGEALIYVRSEDNSNIYTVCAVTVKAATVPGTGTTVPVKGVSFNETDPLELTVGQTYQTKVVVLPENATNKNVNYYYGSETNSFVINDLGKVTAKSAGEGYIYVSTQDGYKDARCKVVVKAATTTVPVKGVTLDKTSLELTVGQTAQLTATVSPTNATNKTVSFYRNSDCITVDKTTGLINAIYPGETYVAALTADGAYATCTVIVKAATTTVPVTGVTLDKTSVELTVGQTAQLTATVVPANATNRTVTYASNSGNASVDASGKITAKTAGTSIISVRTADGNRAAICTVVVKAVTTTVPVTGVTLDKTSLELTVGQTAQLTATVQPANATNRTILYSATYPDCASVDARGKVTAKAVGTSDITVITADGYRTKTCTVVVKAATTTIPVTGVTLDKGNLELTVGQIGQLTATVQPANATNRTITYASNSGNVSVDASGKITAKTVGTSIISVRTADGNRAAICTVVVKAATTTVPVTGVKLDKGSLELTVQQIGQLVVTVEPANATNKNVTYVSSSSNVSVDGSGKITANRVGTSIITVKTADGNKTAICTVVVKEIKASKFRDVPEDHWAYIAITQMVEKGIIEGYGNNKFNPEDPVTREQFAKILVKSLNIPTQKPAVATFEDIKSSDWSYEYVEAAKAYLTGYKINNKLYFRPSLSSVREDMAVAVVKARKLNTQTADVSVLSQFLDKASISPNLANFVAIAVKNDIMKGYSASYFGAKNTLTRAEACQLIYNVIINLEDGEKVIID